MLPPFNLYRLPMRLIRCLFFTALVNTAEEYRDLLAQYPGETNDIPKPSCKPAHGVYHHIETTGPPVFA